MKKNFSFALFSLCSLMMLAPSCSSEDSPEETPIIPEVGNFGEIKFDREKFGYGQTFTASCQLPTTSTNISDLTYSWYINGELLEENTVSNGTSSITFTLPTPNLINFTPSEYKIELKASTTSEAKLPAPATATVKPQYTDAYLSFWGDNVELTQKNVPGLTGSNDVYTVTMKDYILTNNDNASTQSTYNFTDGKLSKVDETHIITINSSQLGEFFSTFKGMMSKTLEYYNLTTTQSIISFDDQTQKDFNYNSNTEYNKDDFELDIFVLGGKITIHAENDNTELVISAVGKTGETPSDYAINCTFTYTPKN